MNRRCVTLALLFTAMLLLNIGMVNVSPVSAQPPEWDLPVPRDKTISVSGYWPDPAWATSVPCIMDWGQCMETYIMYEPLFGTDVGATEPHRIKWLGENIEWLDPTTIKITLRKKDIGGGKYAPYWVKITDWDAWQACTGGVEYYRPINATDVWFSFYLYGGLPESPDGKYWHAGALRDRITSMEIVDDKTLLVHIKPEYANSVVVMRRLTASYLIVPFDVWQQIEAQFGWIPDVKNIWTDPVFRADHPDWLVASGMYLPYQHQVEVSPHYTLMKKNPLWWGKYIFKRVPAPDYFANLHFATNAEIYGWMTNCWIDWDGNYVPKDTWVPPCYKTYFYDPPYFADKSAKILVPNHRRWPLCEPWLSRAIYGVVAKHFNDYNSVSEGYLKPASPLYIPADDAVARRLLNTTIEDYFKPKPDGTLVVKAPDGSDVWKTPWDILDMYGDFIGGAWYMNLDPDKVKTDWVAKYLSDDVYLQIGETTMKASEWNALADWSIVDDLPDPGIQVKLPSTEEEAWIINDIDGWSDINAISLLIADHLTNELKINFKCVLISYGDYESKMNKISDASGVAFDYTHYCMHWGINGEMYERYAQMFNGPPGAYNNYGDNRNPEISALLAQLDTAPYGSPEEQEIANQIQWLVGYWCNPIATAGHPDWFLYKELYWCRWPTQDHKFLPASPYGGSTQVANLHFMLLALGSSAPGAYADIDNNHVVELIDILETKKAYGSYPCHERWDFTCDIFPTFIAGNPPKPRMGNGKVDLQDILEVKKNYGKTW
ncbi:MAG: hypothetical protein QW270_01365 [Candidatus Bathyarchaeia archaeon]